GMSQRIGILIALGIQHVNVIAGGRLDPPARDLGDRLGIGAPDYERAGPGRVIFSPGEQNAVILADDQRSLLERLGRLDLNGDGGAGDAGHVAIGASYLAWRKRGISRRGISQSDRLDLWPLHHLDVVFLRPAIAGDDVVVEGLPGLPHRIAIAVVRGSIHVLAVPAIDAPLADN